MKRGRFQIQHWSHEHNCTCEINAARSLGWHGPKCPYPGRRWWEPMENGAAASVWVPRSTPQEAAVKCLMWTGLTKIPAMRVVDLASGDVVWQPPAEWSPEIPDPVVLPSWHEACG